VKAAEDQFAFAWVGVDVAHRKNARFGGRETFGVHFQLFARHGQAPVCDGAQLRAQAEQDPQGIAGQAAAQAFRGGNVKALKFLPMHAQARDLAQHERYLPVSLQAVHLCLQSLGGIKRASSVQQGDAPGWYVAGLLRQTDGRFQRVIVATDNHQVLLRGRGRTPIDVVKDLLPL
jgi:hypothetical protein